MRKEPPTMQEITPRSRNGRTVRPLRRAGSLLERDEKLDTHRLVAVLFNVVVVGCIREAVPLPAAVFIAAQPEFRAEAEEQIGRLAVSKESRLAAGRAQEPRLVLGSAELREL